MCYRPQAAADPPQLEAFRRELVKKAERFYVAFVDQAPQGEQARSDLAGAHARVSSPR